MAIHPFDQEVPARLPAAKLYLDDVEEIVRILTEAEAKSEKANYGQTQPQIELEVEDQKCDELADLPKVHPPVARNFLVGIDRTGFHAYVRLSTSHSTWNVYGLGTDEQWGLFHKLERVFEARRRPWKNLLHSHRGLSYALEGASSAMFVSLLSLAVLTFGRVSRGRTDAIIVWVVLCGALAIALWLGLKTHSIVILQTRSHHFSERHQTAWRVVPDIVKLVLAFLLGLVAEYMRHRFWR